MSASPEATASAKTGAAPGARAGLSDEAVAARTGKTWAEWFGILNDAGAADMDQRAMMALLGEHGLGAWWRPMVAAAYQRSLGRRETKPVPKGFAATITRIVSATMPAAYGAWERPTRRKRFLDAEISFATRRDGKALRFGWRPDSSRVSVQFIPRSKTRTQVTIEHELLKSADDVARMEAFWTEALDRMQALVEKSD